MKHFRKMEHSAAAEDVALDVARRWAEVEKLARYGVKAADVLQTITSPHLLEALADAARGVVSKDLVPTVAGPMPHAAPTELPKRHARVRQPHIFPRASTACSAGTTPSPRRRPLPTCS